MNRQIVRSGWFKTAALVVLAGLVTACGGSSSGGGAVATSSGVSYGRITGFGSVIVNGKHFEVEQIRINGQSATRAELSKGMLVRLEGEWNDRSHQGHARLLEFDDNLRGKITQVSYDPKTGRGELTVLGQTVVFNDQTVIRGSTAAKLSAGDTVSISGWYQGNGTFLASLIRVGSQYATDEVELEGTIKKLDASRKLFFIGGLKVSYNTARVKVEGQGTSLANGLYVEVEGHMKNGVLQASEVEAEDDRLDVEQGEDVEVTGPISQIRQNGHLVINGITMVLSEDVELEEGMKLTEGLKVQVEGEWNSQGQLVVEEIERRDGDVQVTAAIVAAPDVNNRQLNAGGVTVQVSDSTLIISDREQGATPRGSFGFKDLEQGWAVEVSGIREETASGEVYIQALRIEVQENTDGVFTLEAQLKAKPASATLQLLGVELHATNQTQYGARLGSLADLSIGAELEVQYRASTNNPTYYQLVEVNLDD